MSGPAAGAIAAARIGQQSGHPNLIGCDMGGTSFDVSLIRDGEPALSAREGHRLRRAVARADDRHPHDRRRRRLDRAHHQGRHAAGRARERRRRSGPDLLRPRRHRADRHRRQPGARAGSIPAALPGVAGGVPIETIGAAHRRDRSARRWASTRSRRRRRSSPSPAISWPSAIRLVSIEKGYDPRDFALFAVRRRRSAARRRARPRARHADGAGAALSRASPRRWAASWPTCGTISCRRVNQPLMRSTGRDRRLLRRAGEAEGRALIEAEGVPVAEIETFSRGRSALSRPEPRDAGAGRSPASIAAPCWPISRSRYRSASTSSCRR